MIATRNEIIEGIVDMTTAQRLELFVALRDRGICTRCGALVSRRSPHKCEIPHTEDV
jgi:hypothetical protein